MSQNFADKPLFVQLEGFLDEYLVEKAPYTLPENVKDILVKFAPWMVIIGILFGLQALFFILRPPAYMQLAMYYGGLQAFNYISAFFLAIVLVLEGMAVKPLMEKEQKGWRLMFYATLVNIIASIVSANFIVLILGGIIGLYLLFQLKSRYK